MKPELFNELKRKIAHFSGIAWVLASYYLAIWPVIQILLAFLFIAVIHAFFCRHFAKIPLVGNFFSFLHSMSRREERQAKFYFGAVYFFASLAAVLYLTQNLQIFRAAALVLIFADGASAIIGKIYGKTKLPWNKNKSFEGSISGFAAALIAASFVLPLWLAILVSFAGTLIESVNWKLNDNLAIPLGVGFLLWLLL